MPALTQDITIDQGATFQREFTVVDSAGVAFDFTGYTVTAVLKTSGGVKVADFTTTVTGNKILIELPEAMSLIIPPTTNFQHRYIVTATHPTAPDYRIAQGNALISAN